MLGITVFLVTVSLCSASVNVENELREIQRILVQQEMEIQELKNENRDLRADLAKITSDVEKIKADSHGSELTRNITVSQNKENPIQNRSANWKSMIRNEDVISLCQTEPVAFYAYLSDKEPNPSLNHAIIFDVVKTNVGGG